MLGKISLLQEWPGPGCPGQWWSPHPWRGSKNIWMWHFKTRFSRHGGVGVMVGLDDLRGHAGQLLLPRRWTGRLLRTSRPWRSRGLSPRGARWGFAVRVIGSSRPPALLDRAVTAPGQMHYEG